MIALQNVLNLTTDDTRPHQAHMHDPPTASEIPCIPARGRDAQKLSAGNKIESVMNRQFTARKARQHAFAIDVGRNSRDLMPSSDTRGQHYAFGGRNGNHHDELEYSLVIVIVTV